MSFCFSHLSFVKSLEAVADSKHLVALGDSHSDGRPDGGVHTGRRRADVQHGHVEGALRATGHRFKLRDELV